MATTSQTLTVEITGDATTSGPPRDVNWDSVVEKMNSTPGTPREEAKELHIPAEAITAPTSPSSPASVVQEGENAQKPVKSTLRMVPKSPEDEVEIPSVQQQMSPLDISAGKENPAQSPPIQTSVVEPIEEFKSSESQIVDTLKANDRIPVADGNSHVDETPRTELPLLDSATDENKTGESLNLMTPPTDNTGEKDQSLKPLPVEDKGTRVDVPEEEKEKVVEVTENTTSIASDNILEEDKKEETSPETTTMIPLKNDLEEGKKEEEKKDDTEESKPEISIGEEKVGEDNEAKRPLDTETTPTPSSPQDQHQEPQPQTQADEKISVADQALAIDDSSLNHPKERKGEDLKIVTDGVPHPETSSAVSRPNLDNGSNDNKKSLQLLTKLKRKLSTKNMRAIKTEDVPPTPTRSSSPAITPTTATTTATPLTALTAFSSTGSSTDAPKHIESQKPKPSPKSPKKIDTIFKSIRAAMSFSRSPRSPTVNKTATGPPPAPTPITTRSRTWDRSSKVSSPMTMKPPGKLPERPSTAKAALKSYEKPRVANKSSEKSPLSPTADKKFPSDKPTQTSLPRTKPSVRRSDYYVSPMVNTPLRSANTWSPATPSPVLPSNPNAKLYTIWPRYPVVQEQIDEIQAVLDGFLMDEKKAIEKGYAPGGGQVNFWKAPLTSEQSEVVKGNKFVSDF